MTTLKKLFALILAVLMLCMCIVADAATITIDGGNINSKYEVFLLLNATVDPTDSTKIAYSVNEKYADVLKTVTGDVDPVTYLKDFAPDGEDINEFAEVVYAAIKEQGLNADAEITGTTPANVETGYVLVAETVLGDSADTYSLLMLNTAKDDTLVITTKEAVPELVKKLKEKNDSTGEETTWQDGADYDVGDDVPFQLTGTVSSKYGDYDSYYYQFTDKLSEGLTFNDDISVKVVNGSVETVVTNSFVTEETNDGFTVTCKDLKTIDAINKDSKIVVEYTARLNDSCVIGSKGNPNEAMLKYNNNPYCDGTGTGDDSPDSEKNTSETPWDKVIVFTYQLKVTKVDTEKQPLEGATFELHKKVTDESGAVSTMLVEKIESADISEFVFERLDAGDYILKETKAPGGYNPIADIEFKVEATYDTEAADPALNTLTVSDNDMAADKDTGIISADIVNQSGAVLPETGGIGTTIFYVAGGVLVLLAVVLLVTKRRMGENK